MVVAFLSKLFTVPHIAFIIGPAQLGIHIWRLWCVDVFYARGVFIKDRSE